MTDDQNEPSPRDAAIDWLMRCNEGPLSRAERAELAEWLEDDAHRAAFEDICAMYGRLTTMDFGVAPARRRSPFVRAIGGAAAAAVLAAAALFLFFDDLAFLFHADHYAGAGAPRHVTLADGSRVELDARSAITLHFGPRERRLTLLEGEAWFEVAPDPSRPFVVEAGGGTVTALGTAFDVALRKERTDVTVGEHRVAVTSGGRTIVVGESERSAYAPDAAAQAPSETDVARATSWRQGALIFENATLGEVIETIGRYHRGRVFLADPALRARRVSGVFGSDDPREALQEVEAALGLREIALTGYLIMLYR
ncbi:FecR family protein [Methylosinus sp. LW4]|uniref:FecR family protein n=1 Tax=Methylosinus sp. LW4 TaxID=136993 RepID=UPI00037C4F9D|nr:FecR domain-containing protein [Methylosinus sp. LW4]